MQHPHPKQWEPLAWVPIVAGLYWLLAHHGLSWWFWALLPGSFLLASGIGLLMTPGDPRTVSLMAIGGSLGLLFVLPAWWVADFATAALAALLSLLSLMASGRSAIRRAPIHLGATPPDSSWKMDLKVALDEAILGYFVISARIPSGAAAVKTCEDALRMGEVMSTRGWAQDPDGLHPAPPAPEESFIERRRFRRHEYEVLRFDSDYAPPPDAPNAAIWRGHLDNGECQVRILRHPGRPRPWLLCIHGYRMGADWLDFTLFPPAFLHEELGYNLILPVLPLHGARRVGWQSGDYFLDGDLSDLVYAESQALWDLRRTLAWLRAAEPDARVGVYGISLGGYNAALLAGYESQLDFVVAGIPVVDLAHAIWSVAPPAHRQFYAEQGLDEPRYRQILRPVSPLTRPPLLDRQRLFIVGATADRICPPSQALQLARHWNVPVQWYQGSHLSVRRERELRDTLRLAIARAGWPED